MILVLRSLNVFKICQSTLSVCLKTWTQEISGQLCSFDLYMILCPFIKRFVCLISEEGTSNDSQEHVKAAQHTIQWDAYRTSNDMLRGYFFHNTLKPQRIFGWGKMKEGCYLILPDSRKQNHPSSCLVYIRPHTVYIITDLEFSSHPPMSSGSLVRAKGKTCHPIGYSPAHQRGDGADLSATENPPERGMSVTSNTEMYIA